MSRPGRPPRSQRRLLTDEDERLWMTVAKSVQPSATKKRVAAKPEPDASVVPVRAGEPSGRRAAIEGALAPLAEMRCAEVRRADRAAPPLAEFDVKQARRIASGRVRIDARLDLHGMRADEAREALRRFVFGCFASGKRSLLVITGKGTAADDRLRPFELSDSRSKGVLKRSVPVWLAEPELRMVVVSFTPAHPRHGGDGALYVRLRSHQRVNRASDD